MRLVLRIQMEPEPEHKAPFEREDTSSDSGSETDEDPEEILDSVKGEITALEPAIGEIAAQLEGIIGRIQTQTTDGFRAIAHPKGDAVAAWLAREGLEDKVSLEAFFAHLFRIAVCMDLETRTITFSKDAIAGLGIPEEIGLYELIRKVAGWF